MGSPNGTSMGFSFHSSISRTDSCNNLTVALQTPKAVMSDQKRKARCVSIRHHLDQVCCLFATAVRSRIAKEHPARRSFYFRTTRQQRSSVELIYVAQEGLFRVKFQQISKYNEFFREKLFISGLKKLVDIFVT